MDERLSEGCPTETELEQTQSRKKLDQIKFSSKLIAWFNSNKHSCKLIRRGLLISLPQKQPQTRSKSKQCFSGRRVQHVPKHRSKLVPQNVCTGNTTFLFSPTITLLPRTPQTRGLVQINLQILKQTETKQLLLPMNIDLWCGRTVRGVASFQGMIQIIDRGREGWPHFRASDYTTEQG